MSFRVAYRGRSTEACTINSARASSNDYSDKSIYNISGLPYRTPLDEAHGSPNQRLASPKTLGPDPRHNGCQK